MSLNMKPKKVSSVTAEVEWTGSLAPLSIVVRYVPPVRKGELLEKATTRKGGIDWGKFAESFARECFVEGHGLTEQVFARLVEIDEDGERPYVGSDGEIQLTDDIFAFLYRWAEPADFADRITEALEIAIKERDAAKNG